MRASNEYLKEIIEQLGEDWKEKLDSYLKEDESNLDEEIESNILNFLNVCKDEVIAEKTANLQKVEKLINNDMLYKNVRNYVDGLLVPYYASAPLRVLEVKNAEEVQPVIEGLFQNAILRYDPHIMQKYEEYYFDNIDSFVDFLNVLDALCSFAISKNLAKSAIEEFVNNRTRLSKKTSEIIAQLIDKNFEQLKLNFIIDKLKRL